MGWSGAVRVLVVEDEERLAAALGLGLRAEGYLVTTADNGIDGLWHATESSFDAIVLDIMLPGLNGYEVLRRLRAAEVWTPVLMLTAKDGEYDQADAFDFGADDYLTKPFSFVVLCARLRALVRRGAPKRPVILTVGTLSLDPIRRVVRRNEQLIDLTTREFELLHHLMRHAGVALGKTDIVRDVWDAHYSGDENIVEVYVGYLRRKIDAPFGTNTIHTVRGFGYRLDEAGSVPISAKGS